MALKIIHAEKAYIIVDSESQEQPPLDLMRIIVRLRTELAQALTERDEARDELGFARQAAQEQAEEAKYTRQCLSAWDLEKLERLITETNNAIQ